MREVRQSKQNLVPRLFRCRNCLVQFGDLVADLPRFSLLGFGFGRLLLRHQKTDFLRDAIPLRLQAFDFREQFATPIVQLQKRINFNLIPCPAAGQSFPDKIRLFANQFDVQHRGIIGRPRLRARAKPKKWLACGW